MASRRAESDHSLCFACQWQGLGRALNYLPGLNATAALHDAWANGIYGNSTMSPIYNFGTMLPAAATAYLAILHNQGLIINPPKRKK